MVTIIYNLLILLVILALFYLLGKAADLVIYNVRTIGEKLGIKIFFLGLILGLFTSLPELTIGVNAIISQAPTISLGNLLGGIIVLFGLVLGISLILNRRVKTDGKMSSILPIIGYIFFPLILGLDGQIGFGEGVAIIGLYFVLIYYLYLQNKNHKFAGWRLWRNGGLKNFFFMLLGLALVIIFSSLIIRFSLILIRDLNLKPFVVGLLLFAIGTNLPEIIVTVRSWRRNVRELSLSNLVGSAMANIVILGFFSVIRPMPVTTSLSYFILIFFIFLISLFFLIFYKTGKQLTRNEGIILMAIYFAFVLVEVYFLT